MYLYMADTVGGECQLVWSPVFKIATPHILVGRA